MENTGRSTFLLSRRSKPRHINKKVSSFLSQSTAIRESLNSSLITIASADNFNPHRATVNVSEAGLGPGPASITEVEDDFQHQLNREDQPAYPSYESEEKHQVLLSVRKWSLSNNITRGALHSLLKILKSHECFCDWPSDPRTILGTPKLTDTVCVADGRMCYFGVRNGLLRCLKLIPRHPNHINLQVNIDGLPIFKSSSVQFWPILAHVELTQTVFPVAIYLGEQKPSDLDSFLGDFVSEISTICAEGLVTEQGITTVTIRNFICDALARAFICAIKNHTGYFGCGKCEVKGKYVQNRVVLLKTDIVLRTDQSFRCKSQPRHHVGDTPLAGLKIDMVNNFPYEYMHLVCLGVTKKLLKLWIEGKRLGYRLHRRQVTKISENLFGIRNCVSNDFARRPRTLMELDRWKATEFRAFLLYTGPIVLHNCLQEKYFENFMCLCVSIRLLAEPGQTPENISYAESLLEFFVHTFTKLYGRESVSYNVHGLIHLANDVRNHGHLDNFSAFFPWSGRKILYMQERTCGTDN